MKIAFVSCMPTIAFVCALLTTLSAENKIEREDQDVVISTKTTKCVVSVQIASDWIAEWSTTAKITARVYPCAD